MKELLRFTLGFLCGFLVTFLLSFAFTEFMRNHFLPYPFQLIMVTLTSGILECFLGGIVAGYISRRQGLLLGALSSYAFILASGFVSNWVFKEMLGQFSPEIRREKIYDVFELNREVLLNATAMFMGLIGGKVGEAISKIRSKPTVRSNARIPTALGL